MNIVGPLGGKFDFFSPSGFEIQSDFDYRTSKIKFYYVRALKCYLNEKNLIQGRVKATISKFSPQSFETYCRIFQKMDLKMYVYLKNDPLKSRICPKFEPQSLAKFDFEGDIFFMDSVSN